MKRYIAVLEIDDDCEMAGNIDATVSYTYRENGTNYATTESVEFKAESEELNTLSKKPCKEHKEVLRMKLVKVSDGIYINPDRVDGVVTSGAYDSQVNIYCGGSEEPFTTRGDIENIIDILTKSDT